MSEKDGGPAFPAQPTQFFEGAVSIIAHNGMTLRDWFAGKAPISIADAAKVGGWSEEETFSDDLTRTILFTTLVLMRYEYADAMLKERSK